MNGPSLGSLHVHCLCRVTEFAFSTDVINFVGLIWDRLEYFEHLGRSLKGDFDTDELIILE
jgi:hypothetical protein